MLKRIGDLPPSWPQASRPCLHPEHNPPSLIVLEPGVYEYQCPGCGKTIVFTVFLGPTL